MKHNLWILPAYFAFALTSACGLFYGESTAPTVKDIPGTYALVTYDGKPLPREIDSTLSVLSDSLTLEASGAYREIIVYLHPNGSSVVLYTGRYSFDGGVILVQFDSGGGFILEIPERGMLTEHDGNGTLVYAR